MFKVIFKVGNIDIKKITNDVKKVTNSKNIGTDKYQQEALEDYRKQTGIKSVDLNEDLYDY